MSGRSGPERERVLFVHLQKTAGTAVLRRLRNGLGADAIYPHPDEQGTPEVVLDVERMRASVERPGSPVQVVTGHFPLAAADLLAPPIATFTILRDPVERVLSFLRHQREVEPRFAAASLEAIYDDPVTTSGLVHDHMVKMLSLDVAEMDRGALTPMVVDEARVDRARQALLHRVDVVGFQERFEDVCRALEERFGWDLGAPLFMNRTTPAPATDALRARIAVDSAHDVALHAWAWDLYQTSGTWPSG